MSKVLEKTVKHTNFYENLAEAQMRLLNTIVVYDHEKDAPGGLEPYFVLAICNHRKDGVFRIYLDRLTNKPGTRYPDILSQVPRDHPSVGTEIDKWMEQGSNADILIRKKMDSKYFHNFRPFPLGMCNLGGEDGRCIYIERTPVRHREQGLTASMLNESVVSLGHGAGLTSKRGNVHLKSAAFRACVRGEYPSPEEVLKELKNPKNGNEAVGFHRMFAVVKGPMDLLFVGYKDKIIGLLPNGDFSEIRLGRDYAHTREAVEELKLFDRIVQK